MISVLGSRVASFASFCSKSIGKFLQKETKIAKNLHFARQVQSGIAADSEQLNRFHETLIVSQMSASEILAELPKLSLAERRRLAAAIFDLEEEADLLRDCDRRADERFRVLDAMEEEDGKARSR